VSKASPSSAGRIDVRALLEQHGLWARRALGQCFLNDRRVLAAIAAAATAGGEPVVIEIGAGLGALTEALADTGARVLAIERDQGLVRVLETTFRDRPSVEIVSGDATALSFADLAPDAVRPAVAGNLPYSVTSPLLLALLHQRARLGPATVMIQREVAERLLAGPGTKAYGSLSILFRLHSDLTEVLEVPPSAFWPAPKVHSTVLRLVWRAAPRVALRDPAFFESVVRAAFGQRRKTLRNALGSAFGRERVVEAGLRSGISLERRAETLGLEEFAALTAALDAGG
jgi:16S rRNA (adenine1518-N6/adenine1519-N6)-dimethyltransferase